MSDKAPDETIPEHWKPSRDGWRKVILGLPLLFFALCFLHVATTPQIPFVDNPTPGIYWLVAYYWQIAAALLLAAFLAAVLGLMLSVRKMILRKSLNIVDRLTWANLVLVPLMVLFFLTLLGPMVGSYKHITLLDTEVIGSHVYHLSQIRDNPTIYGKYVTTYAIFECGRFGLWCHRIYRSEDQGDPPDNEDPLRGTLEFDPQMDIISLVDNGNTLFSLQISP